MSDSYIIINTNNKLQSGGNVIIDHETDRKNRGITAKQYYKQMRGYRL